MLQRHLDAHLQIPSQGARSRIAHGRSAQAGAAQRVPSTASRPAPISSRVTTKPKTNPPTWAKDATPLPPVFDNNARLPSKNWYRNQPPRKDPRRDHDREPQHEREDARAGDRAPGRRPARRRSRRWRPGRYLRVGRRAEEQGHRGLQHNGREPACEVEQQVDRAARNAFSTFLPKSAENHMLPRMWSQPACKNIAVIQLTPHGRPMWQVLSTIARIERRLVDRRIPVGQLVEQEDREVGDDQRDVDPREPAGRNVIGVRDHGVTAFPLCPPRFWRTLAKSIGGR